MMNVNYNHNNFIKPTGILSTPSPAFESSNFTSQLHKEMQAIDTITTKNAEVDTIYTFRNLSPDVMYLKDFTQGNSISLL